MLVSLYINSEFTKIYNVIDFMSYSTGALEMKVRNTSGDIEIVKYERDDYDFFFINMDRS